MVIDPLTKVTAKYVFLLNMCFGLIVGVWNFIGFYMFFLIPYRHCDYPYHMQYEVINFNSCCDVIDIA